MTSDQDRSTGIPRRTFVKGVGAAAGAGLLGVGVPGTVAAEETIDPQFANWRTLEAAKVWEKGYRGHPERTIGLTDTGVDARHPDVGPWNGVRIDPDGEALETVEEVETEVAVTEFVQYDTEEFSGTAGPGAVRVGFTDYSEQFTVANADPDGLDRDVVGRAIDATLTWNADTPGPQANDADFELEWYNGKEWERVALSGRGGDELQEEPRETLRYEFTFDELVEEHTDDQLGAAKFRFYIVGWRGMSQYDIEARIEAEVDTGETETDTVFEASEYEGSVFADVDPDDITPDTPKLVGWYDANASYGHFPNQPRDQNGHGTHVSGIMTGTGQASAVDPDSIQEGATGALLPGDVISHTIEAEAGTGVFASVFGEWVELELEGPDGRSLYRSDFQEGDATVIDDGSTDGSNVVVQHPTVHDSGPAEYTVHARPKSGEFAAVARITRFVYGTFLDPESTVGDRTADGDQGLHTGMAPNQSLVGFGGLSAPFADLGNHAEWFADTFNLRSVNMSWGGLPNERTGTTGRYEHVKSMAEGGILTVSSAGNNGPLTGSTGPSGGDEAIAVVATGPQDGIAGYSSGGTVVRGEDGELYRKPDVTAPGGTYTDMVQAAKTGDPDSDEGYSDVRDYAEKAGTSMAAPYVNGAVGLIAEAMDEEYGGAPDTIALPVPGEAGDDDVLRLKQVVLATASETAFTAAPYHRGHAPTYDFGERDQFEGYGRVNPDAAVDAVSRDLLPDLSDPRGISAGTDKSDPDSESETHRETVGLNVPGDARAVAGYVDVRGGTLEASVAFDYYSGGNKGMTKGDPHVDLFVYDAETPTENGEPNVVAAAQGLEGDASVSVDIEQRATRNDGPTVRTFYVVAKLVNVPGVVNGYDVQANLDLSVSYTAPEEPAPLPSFTASGTREDDGHAVTQGGTQSIDVTVESFSEGVTEVSLSDEIPEGWTLQPFADAPNEEPIQGPTTVDLVENVSRGDLETDEATRTYIVEATGDTGGYEFGPAEATIESTEDDATFENETAELVGTETNYIVGVDQNDPAGSAAEGASSSADGSSATDEVTDTVEDSL